MLAILTLVFNWLGGPIVSGAVDAYKAKLTSDNTAEKTAADLMVQDMAVKSRQNELNSQIIVAEQGRWWTALPRPLFAAPFIIFLWKVIVWDKVLGLGVTDNLSPELWDAGKMVLTAYFVGRSVEKAASVLKPK